MSKRLDGRMAATSNVFVTVDNHSQLLNGAIV